ncbi:MAG: hypothetical protein V4666_08585 [Bacteroidota bacterium]
MKILIYAFLFISSLSFSQEIYTFKSGGRVFENGKRIKTSQIETYFGHKPEIVRLYKAGRTQKTIGNVFLYGGVSTFIFTHLSKVSERKIQPNGTFKEASSNTMYFVGAGIALVSIPIKIGYSKKIKKAVGLMNEEVNSQKQNTGLNFETNIIADANGVGLKITF